jgi:hypothetical protein
MMKNPLSWKQSFNGMLLIESQLLPIIFDIKLKMEILSDDFEEQRIALQRIQTIIENAFDASIICEMTEAAADMPYTFNNNIVAIPGTPTDQLLCGMMYTKTNAVSEGKIRVNSVSISSSLNVGVEYYFDSGTPLPLFLQKAGENISPWWLRNDISTTDSFVINNNVIHFPLEYSTWEELELSWVKAEEKSDQSQENQNTGTVINFNTINNEN